MKPQEYQKLVQKHSPPRPLVKNMLWAFFVGGTICAFGQVALYIAEMIERTNAEASSVTLAMMILVGTILTGIGVMMKSPKREGPVQPYRLQALPIR